MGCDWSMCQEFKYFSCVFVKDVKIIQIRRTVACAIRSLQLECVRVLQEALTMPFFLYDSEAMI